MMLARVRMNLNVCLLTFVEEGLYDLRCKWPFT